MNHKTGVLLINLGTPKSPSLYHVFRYLNEFLTDGRVIDYPWLKRQLLVRGVIIPARLRQTTALYKKLWTPQGSPLLVHGIAVKEKLQNVLGSGYHVALGMRYQAPSIQKALDELQAAKVNQIVVLPLFPQYASASTGSVQQKVMEEISSWQVIPKLTFIDNFYDHPGFIQAFCERAKQYQVGSYDHVLFSFHGLPERQLQKCDGLNYKEQCFATAKAITAKLKLDKSHYTVCFQSRLGKDPWIKPYTQEVIEEKAKQGSKRMLVFCPAFVCDCLETTIEISYEYDKVFKKRGGEALQLVEGLNSHPAWIEALKEIVQQTK